MIAVIADDFTGAAEIAGIGLKYNLSVQLFTNSVEEASSELIIISTDSRSLNKTDAIQATGKAVKEVLSLKPGIIYKKTDSVLRGYVVDELKEQMQLQNINKALLLPANPSLKRTIVNGNYYVDNILINKTSFATDPEFSISNSGIEHLLKAESYKDIFVLNHTDTLPSKGIVVGEVLKQADIKKWLNKVDREYVLAGAGDCFEVLLQELNYKEKQQDEPEFLQPYLYVSGTSFGKSVSLIKEISRQPDYVRYLSKAIFQQEEDVLWYNEVFQSLQKHQKGIIAIDNNTDKKLKISALDLRAAMAKAVKKVVEENEIQEILIEGGSTAAAILKDLGINHLVPDYQLARGVIRMKANDLFVTVKPGSYELPDVIKRLFNV